MKKLIAASLLSIYLFNIGGQLALHQISVYLSYRFFIEQTAKGFYNVNDLTEVKLPVNMPGITDWAAYENISGQIKFENVCYNYVKMKITRTALYLMCVPDYATTRFASQNIINAKRIKDIPVPKKDHVPYGKTVFLSNVSFAFTQFTFSSPAKSRMITIVQSARRIISRTPDIPEQPPKFSC